MKIWLFAQRQQQQTLDIKKKHLKLTIIISKLYNN